MDEVISHDELLEEWRPCVGFEGLYDVSNLGRIRRSFDAPKVNSSYPGRMLIPADHDGYLRVTLTKDAKGNRLLVHRIVAKAFLGGMPRQHVNHKDGCKFNNRADNLEWATPRENVRHAWATKLCTPTQGQDHYKAKLDNRDVARIFDAVDRGIPQRQIASVFNVTESNISSIVRGISWRHLSQAEESAA